ncbi:Aldose reductase-related protein 2, partial [Taenia solium]
VNIHWPNTKLIEFCHSKNILVEGYAPLGSPGFVKGQVRPVLEEENVAEIARKHNKTPAQVLLRHGLQRGIVVLVKSVTPERIKSNFDMQVWWAVTGVEEHIQHLDLYCCCGIKEEVPA